MSDWPRTGPDGRAICDRCGQSTWSCSMSFFDTAWCCNDCLAKERAHPDYQKARVAEEASWRRGERNFQGIGKPADL